MKLLHYKILIFFFAIVQLSSCVSSKEIVYFQDQGRDTTLMTDLKYNIIFQSDDILTITVSGTDMEAVMPFNMPIVSFNTADGRVGGNQQLQNYLIDTEGNIDFPVLGKLHLAGLNRTEATNMIKEKLETYIKDPIVNIRLTNFKVTILGEVNRPGSYTIQNERITLPEALGLAGDLKITGERNNVLIIRDVNGIQTKTRVDLTTNEIFNSPFYYLSQNDIIYVEPRKTQIRDASFGSKTTSITFSIVSTIISIAALILR